VPALPPDQRLAAGVLTVIAVFAVVAVVAWRPAVFALPGLAAVAALGLFDALVVTTRGHEPEAPGPRAGGAVWYGGPRGGPGRTVDPHAPTTVVPRLESRTGLLAAPTPSTPPPTAGGFPHAPPRPDAHEVGRPSSRGTPPRPSPTPDDLDMATMAIDMRAFLDT
jgi:hypothetical protein